MPVETIIQSRRDTAANWTSTNPVLAVGEIGYESNTNKLKFGDGTSAWTALGYFGDVPAGVVNPFAGSTAPTDWLLCFGQAISRTTYARLFAVISTTYGVGDGSTTFNLPDLRGRAVAGADNMGGTDAGRLSIANTLGTSTGAETVTLTSAQSGVPAHSHANTAVFTGTAANHTHTQDSHNHTQNAHAHDFVGKYGGSTTISSTLSAPGSANDYGIGGGYVASATATNQAATATNQNTSVTPAGTVAMTNANNTAANAASATNIMQPTMVLNYIIKI